MSEFQPINVRLIAAQGHDQSGKSTFIGDLMRRLFDHAYRGGITVRSLSSAIGLSDSRVTLPPSDSKFTVSAARNNLFWYEGYPPHTPEHDERPLAKPNLVRDRYRHRAHAVRKALGELAYVKMFAHYLNADWHTLYARYGREIVCFLDDLRMPDHEEYLRTCGLFQSVHVVRLRWDAKFVNDGYYSNRHPDSYWPAESGDPDQSDPNGVSYIDMGHYTATARVLKEQMLDHTLVSAGVIHDPRHPLPSMPFPDLDDISLLGSE